MSERTCGNCAWWDDRDKVKLVDGVWSQTAINGETFPYMGPGRCMREPVTVAKEPTDWCRHHATTRGWDEPKFTRPEAQPVNVALGMEDIKDKPDELKPWHREVVYVDNQCQDMLGEAYSRLTSVLHYLEHTTEPPELMAGIRRWLEDYNKQETKGGADNA